MAAKRKAGGRLAPAVGYLSEVWRMGQTLPALPASCRPRDLAEAYRLQSLVAAALGLTRAGWKIGCTSEPARKIMKSDGPFAGRAFLSRCFVSGTSFAAAQYRLRGVEGEFAFVLGKNLKPRKKPYSRAEVLAAIEDLHPAIEVVDSRYTDFRKVTLPELVADMGCNGALVVGLPVKGWRKLDLAKTKVAMRAGRKIVGKGTGAAVMDEDPIAALVWLANNPCTPEGLLAGEIVTTGTCTGLHIAAAGDKIVAGFDGMGEVALNFV
ncbi:MAG: fumarylacetoacetate hydrolase family protein [Alphaproteobacteria bacterium]|nr:fumarylacetoacetate hydrolase family protein [Alphaproteobacteria bacterium]